MKISQIPGMIDISTIKQKQNGTQMWYCPITKMRFGNFKSGYVRISKNAQDLGYMPNPYLAILGWVCNNRVKGSHAYKLEMDFEKREELLAKCVMRWRGYIESGKRSH